MDILDFILNLVGLLLWFGWRQTRARLVVPNAGVSLLSTLRRTDAGERRSHLLSFLMGLLAVRFIVYWQLGQAVDWVATLPFGLVRISFRSAYWDYMLLYSIGSFLHALAVAYLWLIGLSLLHPRKVDVPQNRFVREQLGMLDRAPWFLRMVLPLFVVAMAWLTLGPVLEWMKLMSAPQNFVHRLEQAGVHGFAFYLELRWLLLGLLFLGVLNSYVYLGRSTLWAFVQTVSTTLLAPLHGLLNLPLALLSRATRRPGLLLVGQLVSLRIGRLDLVPVLGMALVFFGAEAVLKGLFSLYLRLPIR